MQTAALALFFLSAAALFYFTLGYPILLMLHRRSGAAIRKEFLPRSVSLVIAVHNGQAFLRAKLESVLALDYPRELMEIMVVSDGSTDDTDAIAAEFAARGVQLLHVPKGGKAAALNAAIPRMHGEILVLTDVRQALAPDSLRLLVSCFADPTVGGVGAELRTLPGEGGEESDIGLYWRYEVWMRKQLSRIGSTFGVSGGYYAMRRELAAPIPPDTISDDVVMLLPGLFRGYRIIFEPAANAYDFPTKLKSEFPRKMRTLGGLWQVYLRHPALLSSANPMRFHFLSQKVGRLLLPYALLCFTFTAVALPAPWRSWMLAGIAVFYALGLLDLIVPKKFFLKRITAAIRMFLVLCAAAFCAASIFFVPADRLWKITKVSQPAGPPA